MSQRVTVDERVALFMKAWKLNYARWSEKAFNGITRPSVALGVGAAALCWYRGCGGVKTAAWAYTGMAAPWVLGDIIAPFVIRGNDTKAKMARAIVPGMLKALANAPLSEIGSD